MSVKSEIDRIETEVTTQTSLIEQIKTKLANKFGIATNTTGGDSE